MQRFAHVVMFILVSILATSTQAVSEEPDAKAGRAKVPYPGGPADQSALWWNDSAIVKDLSLTDEQRKKMSEVLNTYRANVPPDLKPQKFQEALVQANWKNARGESEKLATRAHKAVQMRGSLKIDVLSVLNKKQHQIVVDRYPRLIYKQWRRAMHDSVQR